MNPIVHVPTSRTIVIPVDNPNGKGGPWEHVISSGPKSWVRHAAPPSYAPLARRHISSSTAFQTGIRLFPWMIGARIHPGREWDRRRGRRVTDAGCTVEIACVDCCRTMAAEAAALQYQRADTSHMPLSYSDPVRSRSHADQVRGRPR